MIRRPPRSTLFPSRRSSDLDQNKRYADQEKTRRHDSFTSALARLVENNFRPANEGETGGVPLTDEEGRSEEHTSELQSQSNLVCRLLLEKKKKKKKKKNKIK